MKKATLPILFFIILISACSKENIKIDHSNLLIGIWNYSEYQDNTTIFTRDVAFIENHCYKFNSDGSMTERKNSGFCGTPPISYADYSGTWTILNDTLIQINVGYWGGTTNFKLDIEAIDSKSLKTSFVLEGN